MIVFDTAIIFNIYPTGLNIFYFRQHNIYKLPVGKTKQLQAIFQATFEIFIVLKKMSTTEIH